MWSFRQYITFQSLKSRVFFKYVQFICFLLQNFTVFVCLPNSISLFNLVNWIRTKFLLSRLKKWIDFCVYVQQPAQEPQIVLDILIMISTTFFNFVSLFANFTVYLCLENFNSEMPLSQHSFWMLLSLVANQIWFLTVFCNFLNLLSSIRNSQIPFPQNLPASYNLLVLISFVMWLWMLWI